MIFLAHGHGSPAHGKNAEHAHGPTTILGAYHQHAAHESHGFRDNRAFPGLTFMIDMLSGTREFAQRPFGHESRSRHGLHMVGSLVNDLNPFAFINALVNARRSAQESRQQNALREKLMNDPQVLKISLGIHGATPEQAHALANRFGPDAIKYAQRGNAAKMLFGKEIGENLVKARHGLAVLEKMGKLEGIKREELEALDQFINYRTYLLHTEQNVINLWLKTNTHAHEHNKGNDDRVHKFYEHNIGQFFKYYEQYFKEFIGNEAAMAKINGIIAKGIEAYANPPKPK